MHAQTDLHGVVPIVPTPFRPDETIDVEDLHSMVHFAIRSQLPAVCLPAYASEFYKLSDPEKLFVVKTAVEAAQGKIKIMAQCNSASLKNAIGLAKANIDAGADVVSLAVPRIFSLPEASVEAYLSGFFGAIPHTPVLVQDFNPGGATLSPSLIASLHAKHPNFKYVKLEEPLCAPKFDAIIQQTKGKVGVLEGWGGLYMLELIPVGISGIMPGLGVSDVLNHVFKARKAGEHQRAFDLFEKIMPQIFFSLQNMELFHYAEKQLLKARGIIKNTTVRSMAYLPDAHTAKFVEELNQRVLALVERLP